jgi:hypothetical protein
MEDLPETERRALKKELEEEMAEARRRKLACFQKHTRGLSRKTSQPSRLRQLLHLW